jgi:PST family polysaccharide transporter
LQIIAEILYPAWYFQAIQKMKIVTYIQLFFRILSLPFIFIYIRSSNDIVLYSIIATLSIILPSAILFVYLIKFEKIIIKLQPVKALKRYLTDAAPFFWSTAAGTLKQESVTLILGSLFTMRDVALYDLANKLIMLPRMLTSSINTAIFPKAIEDLKVKSIKKIIRYEWLIGFSVIGFVIVFGYWIILILGGKVMTDAYLLSVILSTTVLVWLVVGSYINFIFLPQNKYYFITKNQLVALLSFVLFAGVGMLIFNSIYIIVGALALSGIVEIICCKHLINKHKLI